MSGLEGKLLACVADTGRQLSAGGANEMAELVRAAGSPAKLISRADGLPTPPQRKLAQVLANAWEVASDVDGAGLAASLRAAQAAAESERLVETVELVWTGPKTDEVAVSRNDQALLELVELANHDLLVVSYATYQVPKLVELLGKVVDRGVAVDLVLEFHGNDPEESQTWDPLRGLGRSLHKGVRVYQWPIEVRPVNKGKAGYIHVKCVVTDGRQAFVSSANLTVYAMEMNMELGIVVRGGDVPRQIARHFRALIDQGILQRVEG